MSRAVARHSENLRAPSKSSFVGRPDSTPAGLRAQAPSLAGWRRTSRESENGHADASSREARIIRRFRNDDRLPARRMQPNEAATLLRAMVKFAPERIDP
jgi:hypothetical protein